MNTSEINGSSWQLKWYFIAAIPLVLLTVLLPLVALPVFNFIRRCYAKDWFQKFAHWSMVILILVLNLGSDIAAVVDNYAPGYVYFFCLLGLISITAISEGSARFLKLYRLSPEERLANLFLRFLKDEKWTLLFFVFAVACFFASVLFSYFSPPFSFISLPPYIIYFVAVWRRNRKQKKS